MYHSPQPPHQPSSLTQEPREIPHTTRYHPDGYQNRGKYPTRITLSGVIDNGPYFVKNRLLLEQQQEGKPD